MPAPHPDGSVTLWLGRLKTGDPEAARALWEGYFRRLVTLARDRLRGRPRGAADEEDVALSAFDSFFRGAGAGRFPRLDDRSDLWRVLVAITARKAIDLARHEGRGKRGGGRVASGSSAAPDGSDPDLLAGVAGPEPTPEFAAEVAEECGRLLELLGDGELRSVAVWKMEGFTNQEIADRLGRSVPTVERKLAAIRVVWERGAGR